MNDITRKQMNDVIVQHNDIIRRPSAVPEPYAAPSKEDEGDRIEKNPFFEKPRNDAGAGEKPKSIRGILWAVLFALFLAGGFEVANYFATATVDITPVKRNVTLNYDITAVKLEGAREGDLAFNFATSTEEKTKEVPATIEKKIQKKASGKVIIYNAYSADSQRLIKNTRLEDNATHKIFRIDTSVVVPGAKVLNGKVAVPGQVEAVVYADVAGKEYNIGNSNFTIPGFKGDPRYTKFYASSKPDSPIAGGFSGAVKIPSDEAVVQAVEELKQDLKKTAVEKARAQIPDNFSVFPGSIILKFEEVPQEPTALDTAKVSMRAVVSVFFFDTVRLTEKIAALSLPENKNNVFLIANMPELAFSFVDPVDNVVLSDISKINIHMSGNAVFVGQVDVQKLRAELLGKNKKDFSKIIDNQSNISKADAVIRPMWKTVFPSDISKITVKVLTQ